MGIVEPKKVEIYKTEGGDIPLVRATKSTCLKGYRGPRRLAYLNAPMEDGDVAVILLALRDVAEAWGVGKVAAEADLNRENVYRILSAEGNPRLSSFVRLLHAVGIELRVQARRMENRKATSPSPR